MLSTYLWSKFRSLTVALLLISVAIAPSAAHCCPDIDGLLDVNCDQKLEIVTFGDSITNGVADSAKLGYPGRLKLIAPNANIYNYGKAGEKTPDGRVRAPARFANHPDADFVIILEGVNDYFLTSHSASATRSNLLSMVNSGKNTGGITLLAKLTAIKRDFQKPWVSAVNSAIAPYTSIDFYSLGTGIISSDQLHPNGAGYQQMANLLYTTLLLITSQERPNDTDGDGIYDFAEPRFGSNPLIADSDGDGLLDGEEVFTYGSSPLLTDTDGDGHGDAEEVQIGANPADPRPTPPTIQSLEALPEET